MFKFLKEKLSKAVSTFSKSVEEEAEINIEEREVIKERTEQEDDKKPVSRNDPEPKKKGFFSKIFHRKEEKEEAEEGVEEKKEIEIEEKNVLDEKKKEKPDSRKEKKDERTEKQAGFSDEKKPDIERFVTREEEDKAKEKPEKYKKEEKEKKEDLGYEESSEEEIAEEEIPLDEVKKEPEPKGLAEKKDDKTAEDSPKVFESVEKVDEEKQEEKDQKQPEGTGKIEIADKKEEEPSNKEESPVNEQKKKGFFAKLKETLTTVKLSEDKFEKLFWELEVVMLENNVAVEVIEKIKEDLKAALTTGRVSRKDVEGMVFDALKESVEGLFIHNDLDLIEEINKKKEKPFIIAFIGVNGSGKTTSMAKIASMLLKNRLSLVFAASDTFRAAAIQQLQEHAEKLGVKMIKHDYDSDPAAVAFDAVKHAQAKGIDVVLIDTAGRLHSNDNLMNELKKLVRVNKPDLKIFVGESITGNDCVEQAKLFNEAVGIDAIVLSKADVDEKGGAAISVSFVTKKPIIYLGTGQNYEDLTRFDPKIIIKNIGL